MKASSTLARAARHDVLRRLAPPLRHDMVVHLQALTMMADLLSARLERGGLAQESLQDAVSRMALLARDAVQSCVDASGWLQQAPEETITAKDAVGECIHLLATSLSFRGFALHHYYLDQRIWHVRREPALRRDLLLDGPARSAGGGTTGSRRSAARSARPAR